jgi:hypothetical protein
VEKDLANIIKAIPGEILWLIEASSTYLVGGAVRDYLLDKPFFDYDFIITSKDFESLPYKLKEKNLKYILLNRMTFPLYRVFLNNFTFDFTTYNNLEEDALKRDFTVNAIYVNVGDLKTYSHPLAFDDLRNRTLRVCSVNSVRNDPVRYMRAFRFLAQYHFSIEEETRLLLHTSKDLYLTSKRERARVELLKFLKNSVDDIKYAVSLVFDGVDFSFIRRILIGEKIPELHKNVNKDSTYLDMLKAYFLSKTHNEFLYGLTIKEMEFVSFMDEKIESNFESLFDAFYEKRGRPEFVILNIVANFNTDLLPICIEVIRNWKKEKVNFSEVEAFAKENSLTIDKAYREVFRRKCRRIYENICHY